MRPRAIRFSERKLKELEDEAQQRGFVSSSTFVRYAIDQEYSDRQDGLTGAEERLAASIEQVRRGLFRVRRAQRALFTYVDSVAKTILTCIPEPPGDAKAQAVARAKERYDRLLKTTGRSVVGDARLAIQDLVANIDTREHCA